MTIAPQLEEILAIALTLSESGNNVEAMLAIDSYLEHKPDDGLALAAVCNLLLDMRCIIQAEAVFSRIAALENPPLEIIDLCKRFDKYGSRLGKVTAPQYGRPEDSLTHPLRALDI